jgi:hypothetical protein
LDRVVPLEVLEDEEVDAALGADVVEHADVGVLEGGDGAGLPLEACPADRVRGEVRGEDLEGDGAAEAGVAGLLNLAHAPGPEKAEDLVRPEASARLERHGRPGDEEARRTTDSKGSAGSTPFGRSVRLSPRASGDPLERRADDSG